MKVRRVTLAVLLVITLVVIADVWYTGVGAFSGPPHFEVKLQNKESWDYPNSVKEQCFTLLSSDLTGIQIENKYGEITIKGTEGDEMTVISTITVYADTEDDAEQYLKKVQVIETDGDSGAAEYMLPNVPAGPEVRGVIVNYEVSLPKNLAASVGNRYGTIRVHEVEGEMEINASFSHIMVREFKGRLDAETEFSTLEIQDFAGSLDLDDSYSTIKVDLVDVQEGYNFDLRSAYGSLHHNIPLEEKVNDRNILRATGITQAGEFPIRIRSNFGTVHVHVR